MSFLDRIFSRKPDPREAMRPLWLRVVEIGREEDWYAKRGVADTVGGRFDMITAVLALTVVRMEHEGDMGGEIAWLTELFVEDMDGQLREFGINDVVVGKHVGKLMSSLGGRMGAYRDAVASGDEAQLTEAAARNIALLDDAEPAALGSGLAKLSRDLAATPREALLTGEIAR